MFPGVGTLHKENGRPAKLFSRGGAESSRPAAVRTIHEHPRQRPLLSPHSLLFRRRRRIGRLCARRRRGPHPRVELIDRTTQGLTSATLEWANGTYGTGCKNPSTGAAHLVTDAWSLRISGSTALTNAALAVTKGDSDCTLSLTAIGTTSTVYPAAPSFALTTSYQGTASSFSAESAKAFYANAKISATDMASDFVVTIAYSDDLKQVDGGTKTGTYAQFSGSADAGMVAAPHYTSGNTITVSANENNTVSTTTGNFTLTVGTQAADAYRVIDGEINATLTFDNVDTAYNAVEGGAAAVTITGSPIPIASSAILAVSVQLPAKRTVIVRRTENGVAAYQVFSLTFSAAP
jgi:hypothetical protein